MKTIVAVTFILMSGLANATPVRDYYTGQSTNSSSSSDSLTAQTGDLIVAMFGQYVDGPTFPTITWTNATQGQRSRAASSALSVAAGTPTGNTTITGTGTSDHALIALVLKP